LKYFGTPLVLDISDCTDNLLKCSDLDRVWIMFFVSVLLNYLMPPGKITIICI